jgi:hypothetical protein
LHYYYCVNILWKKLREFLIYKKCTNGDKVFTQTKYFKRLLILKKMAK